MDRGGEREREKPKRLEDGAGVFERDRNLEKIPEGYLETGSQTEAER